MRRPWTTSVGVLQEGSKNTNLEVNAPVHIQDEVHDQRIVESETVVNKQSGGFLGELFNIRETKTINSSSNSSTSKGCINDGQSFISKTLERFKAVNSTFKTKSHVTSKKIEITPGTNHNNSRTQSTYKGPIWNKSGLSTENQTTHSNPIFEDLVYLHSPEIILEKVKGSGDVFKNLICDSKPTITEVENKHESTSKSTKDLSAGASLLTKLAVGLVLYCNPVTFGLSNTLGVMTNAGFGALCGDAATHLIEQDGNPAKAVHALSKSKVAMHVARSMVTAGLVKEIGDVVGIKSTDLRVADYAQKAVISSAVNTVLAVSIDHQKLEDALKQGLITAIMTTATSYLANQIGGAYHDQQITVIEQKALHGLLGGISGGIASKLCGGKFEEGAISGGVGAILGEFFAELTDSKQLGDFLATGIALGTGLDPLIAYQTASNATEHNFSGLHNLNAVSTLVKAVEKEMTPGDNPTPEQEAYEQGRLEFVEEHKNLSKDECNQLYALEYANNKCSERIGDGILTTSELIPGMHGINQAWMGLVNHTRGNLPEGALLDEVLGGVTSSLGDVALGMATFGTFKVVSVANKFARGIRETRKIRQHHKINHESNLIEFQFGKGKAFDKETFMEHPLMKGKIGPDYQLMGPKHPRNGHTSYSGGYQKSFITDREEVYYRVY